MGTDVVRSRAARVYAAWAPAAFTAFFTWESLFDLAALPYAAAGALATAWAARVAVIVGPDAVVVRNPVRSYRVLYRTIRDATVERDALVGTEGHPVVAAPYLLLLTEDDAVELLATRWLPRRELDALRQRLRSLAARAAASEPDGYDRSPPFAAVRAVLVEADGEYPETDDDADYLADVLRERPLTRDDLEDVVDTGLLDRLNRAGGR